MQTLGLSAAGAAIADKAEAAARAATTAQPTEPAGPAILGPDPVACELNVNGRAMPATIDPATTLLECLRVNLGLTGSKEVCDRASCGACSVLVDGRLVNACMMLALDAVGARVETVEGLATGDTLHPVQTAFIDHDALQCGFCTPGLIVAAKSLLDRNPRPDLSAIRKGLAGNICRCGTYTNVFNAVLVASGQEPVRDAE
jgi:aerobic-type carbon monoxide dehydrogenase small subunit (CoxS/CutS family)